MQIQVSGKHVDVGEALGSRISQELQDGIGKYFERGAQDAEVIVAKEGHSFKVDCWVRLASGQVVFTSGLGGDAHSAFTESLDKLEKRVRRYKRRLKDHHIGPKGLSPEKTELAAREVARSIVLRDRSWSSATPPTGVCPWSTAGPMATSAGSIRSERPNRSTDTVR